MGSQAGWSHAQENSHPVCNIRSWAGLTFVQMTPRYRRATPTPPPRPPSPPSCGARTNPPAHLLFSFALPQIHLTADPTFPHDNIFIISIQRFACCCQSFSAAPELPFGQESVLSTTKIPKYRRKLTKQDSPSQTAPNKHDKKIPKSHFTQATAIQPIYMYSTIRLCFPQMDLAHISHKRRCTF